MFTLRADQGITAPACTPSTSGTGISGAVPPKDDAAPPPENHQVESAVGDYPDTDLFMVAEEI